MKKIIVTFLIIMLITLGVSLFFFNQNDELPLLGAVHEHADVRLLLDGKVIDLAKEEYMSSDEKVLSNFVHLHDLNGNVVHKHIEGITLGFFLHTLDMEFTKDCFTLDTGEKFCNDETNTLKLYVNGKENKKLDDYEFFDLDQILIVYGNIEDQKLQNQINQITDESCIYSYKCPERGEPPEELSCTSDGGCLPEAYPEELL